jgi:anthranilate phosphoribosyltransferase
MMLIQDAIRQVMEKEDLSFEQAHEVMSQIMRGECTDAQIGAYLVSLHMKGETPPEIAGSALAMREAVIQIPTRHSPELVVDTCGTGGDSRHTFNISTVAALVAAGAGVVVAKHGNRSVSSKCGSADLLQKLGVNISATPEVVGRCLDEVGIGFLFAPTLHPAMLHAVKPRREIGVRSIFNILGPLTNPAGAKRQILGVFRSELVPVLAETLRKLGSSHVLVAHGNDGLDELTTTSYTHVSEVREGRITHWEARPEELGVQQAAPEQLAGGDAEDNAKIAHQVLQGEKGPHRDIVVLNAAAAIYVAGKAEDLTEGIQLAGQSIDQGKAMEKLEALKTASQAEE